jgi:maleate cis-trans isomerase
MSLEYSPRGLVGLLTPQANTTVEAEAQLLLPAGMGLVIGRLVSRQPELEDRLKDYFANLETHIAQFGDAPLGVIGLAVTGASYFMGLDKEALLLQKFSSSRGVPVISAGWAVRQALKVLNAKRISLVSPYPNSLLLHSKDYWTSDGFEVLDVSQVPKSADGASNPNTSPSHPVYSLGSQEVIQSLQTLNGTEADVVVLLGTGLPTLRCLLEAHQILRKPVISCNMALAWCCANAVHPAPDAKQSLLSWLEGGSWKQRFFERYSSS